MSSESEGSAPQLSDETSAAERTRASMREIWVSVRPTVVSGVDQVDAALTALVEHRLDEEGRALAARAAHKIAGSAGTFGFHHASELARTLETMFVGRVVDVSSLPSTRVAEAAETAAALRREFDAPLLPHEVHARDSGPQLMVVSPDESVRMRVDTAATARGIGCHTAPDVAAARATIGASQLDVVLLDLSLHDAGALALLGDLAAITPQVLVMVVSQGEEFLDRVEASRAGVTACLPMTLSADRMVEAAIDALQRQQQNAARLLALDDDVALLAALHGLFHASSLQLHTLSDPKDFWSALVETAPDLLLLDLDMPGIGGLELCRLLRADPRWQALPVLVLTASTDHQTIQDVFAAGADDYVTKPVVGPELLTRVTNRLDRVRLFREVAETDPLTGLANRRKFEAEVERLRAMSARYKQPLSFAILDLDRFKRVNDEHGHPMGDQVLISLADMLSRTFRSEDVIARWGGEEFAVAMYGMSRDDGVARVASALESFRTHRFPTADGPPLQVTFSAGVAQFDLDGTDLHEVYRKADEALFLAKEVGRDRVLPFGWRAPPDDEAFDVILVNDDPHPLAQALETRGYRSLAIQDSHEALRRLTGPAPLSTRVILLDVDLPGMRGHDILPELARAGILDHSKVIMLTDLSSDLLVPSALTERAFDQVTKPCTVPVLLQRLRRALAE